MSSIKGEKMNHQFYQGDVGIYLNGHPRFERIKELPKSAIKQPRPKDRIVLEYGEVTGHAHAIKEVDKCNLYLEGTRRFLEVCYAVPLVHEEHDVIVIQPGIYEIGRQRQWSVLEQMSQRVAD